MDWSVTLRYPANAESNTLPLSNRKSHSIYIKLLFIITYQYYHVIEIK